MHQAFYHATCHYANGDLDKALAAARSIAGEEELYSQAARWLGKVAQGVETGAYLDAEAFTAFIRGGGNVAMYAALEKMVAAAWDNSRPGKILEVGPGDGLLLAGALRHSHLQPLPAFDLVEPAADLLSKTLAKLRQHTPPVRAQDFHGTIHQFVVRVPPESHWDLCQATWCLHNLSPTVRAPIFRWLSEHCTILLVAEFDVQTEQYPLLSRQRIHLIHDKYLAGIAEYTGRLNPGLEERVKQGFLMPTMFGYFRSDSSRSTYEQPIQAWSTEIQDAGFGTVRRELIYHYWWADAYLLIAQA